MKIIDRQWKYGTVKAYADVPAEMLQFTPGCRVQPAPYAGKPQSFYLLKRYEPGENKFFPEGGFELRGENSARYSFELDQVVLYQDKKVKVSTKPAAKKAAKKVEVKEPKAAVPKKAASSAPKTDKKVCGAPKKDGTPCQMKTDGGLCRHHKSK